MVQGVPSYPDADTTSIGAEAEPIYPGRHTERGNPVILLERTANRKDGLWDCGQRKTEKAKATRNGVDRDEVNRQQYPTRKRADFRLVILSEKT